MASQLMKCLLVLVIIYSAMVVNAESLYRDVARRSDGRIITKRDLSTDCGCSTGSCHCNFKLKFDEAKLDSTAKMAISFDPKNLKFKTTFTVDGKDFKSDFGVLDLTELCYPITTPAGVVNICPKFSKVQVSIKKIQICVNLAVKYNSLSIGSNDLCLEISLEIDILKAFQKALEDAAKKAAEAAKEIERKIAEAAKEVERKAVEAAKEVERKAAQAAEEVRKKAAQAANNVKKVFKKIFGK